jgi:hypothetical protein
LVRDLQPLLLYDYLDLGPYLVVNVGRSRHPVEKSCEKATVIYNELLSCIHLSFPLSDRLRHKKAGLIAKRFPRFYRKEVHYER